MVTLGNLLLGEIIFGGLGGGLYGIILVALVGVFVAGLMVGRTPEWLGKKLGASEMKLVVLYALVGPLALLVPTAVAVVTGAGRAGLVTNSGPHGFTEIVYAYASSFANNGVSYAGLSANSPFYNSTTALAMLAGRYGLGILALAVAGALVSQPRRPATAGTLPTDTPMFGGLLVGTAVILTLLTYFPALALGPIVEQFAMTSH
jgi:K+-transporting ATPase ATPase A chain